MNVFLAPALLVVALYLGGFFFSLPTALGAVHSREDIELPAKVQIAIGVVMALLLCATWPAWVFKANS